ncbi:hypothetical protein J504_2342 [Acinetobacter baumannii 348935]|nr:hypothetical protein J504_2342 [Acinetobacter baumannii 348935]
MQKIFLKYRRFIHNPSFYPDFKFHSLLFSKLQLVIQMTKNY